MCKAQTEPALCGWCVSPASPGSHFPLWLPRPPWLVPLWLVSQVPLQPGSSRQTSQKALLMDHAAGTEFTVSLCALASALCNQTLPTFPGDQRPQLNQLI